MKIYFPFVRLYYFIYNYFYMKILVVSNKKSKRVSLIPNDVKKLTENKIEVVVLSNAGECCGFKNEDYIKAGAKIVQKLNEVVTKDVSIISFVDFPENKKIFKYLTPRLATISLIFAFTMFYLLMN